MDARPLSRAEPGEWVAVGARDGSQEERIAGARAAVDRLLVPSHPARG